MALDFRRGSAAIEEAATKKGGSDFRPFLPQIVWKADNESKYVLVLTDVQDVTTLLLHSFIPVGKGKKSNGEEFTRYEDFLSRRDPALGEDHDELEDRLEREPKTRCMGVMVELEAVFESGTSKKLKHFVVKTETFTRKSDDGDIDVVAPVIGFCTQSPVTLWGTLNSTYQSLGDLIEVPIQITRRGKDQNTRYDVLPFLEKPVDLSPVIDYIDGISYITTEELPELIGELEAAETETTKAQAIADFLLVKRINELADKERYDTLVAPLELDDMPKNPWGRKTNAKSNGNARPARPARRSPREASAGDSAGGEPAAVAEPAKSDRFAALKQRLETQQA